MTKLAALACLALAACTAGDPDADTVAQPLLQSDDPRYHWLTNMKDAAGQKGNRCNPAIAFAVGCSITEHDDFSCFERATPLEGSWVRQTVHALHCPSFAPRPDGTVPCNGGPGDVDVVRICDPQLPRVMTICGLTGGAGCAVCVVEFNCH